jgi:hypothetical protein
MAPHHELIALIIITLLGLLSLAMGRIGEPGDELRALRDGQVDDERAG